jgi:hypothetical protein
VDQFVHQLLEFEGLSLQLLSLASGGIHVAGVAGCHVCVSFILDGKCVPRIIHSLEY